MEGGDDTARYPAGAADNAREAARLFQPEGSITVASLRAEHARGRLTIFKIGRTHFTTPADLWKMIEACRIRAPGRGFGSTQPGNRGRVSTVDPSVAQAAALAANRQRREQLRMEAREKRRRDNST